MGDKLDDVSSPEGDRSHHWIVSLRAPPFPFPLGKRISYSHNSTDTFQSGPVYPLTSGKRSRKYELCNPET